MNPSSPRHAACATAALLLILLLALPATPVLGQSGAAPPLQQEAIIGAWQRNTNEGLYVLTFHPDGSGTLQCGGEKSQFNWRLAGGMLTMSGGDTVYENQVVITPETLTMTGGNLPGPVTWNRAGTLQQGQQPPYGAPQPPYGGQQNPYGGQQQNPYGNPHQNPYGDQQNPYTPQQQGQGARPGQSDPRGLVGSWQGPQGVVRLKADGTAEIGGQRYQYTANGDVLVLTGSDGSIQIPYQLNGDTLVVVINGQTLTMSRVQEGQAGIRPELVGRWSWIKVTNYASNSSSSSERYLVLNGDGTFVYRSESYRSVPAGSASSAESDTGTWSATETSITFNSRSNGTLTYSLEKRNHPKNNDPMLVIDGECFVTYSPRPPW